MKCDICGEERISVLRVRHRKKGIIFVCEECFAQQREKLGPLPESEGCGCQRN